VRTVVASEWPKLGEHFAWYTPVSHFFAQFRKVLIAWELLDFDPTLPRKILETQGLKAKS
jgi:hypothetical protein